ncbi:transposase [Paenibacillus sp. DXFW5]|uniref:Transposase n=1 Tax=Paenibacillus rhizolycopersici TaxID=2780073 RepID=A0ABS2H8W2_9BACL|nr:transposase [Paenibacillus sp. J53TS2]MBM6996300.1 transposase [Paenibacillus rhizolycopersici]
MLGETGDLSSYAHGNALLQHAGLNLAEASSGKWKGQMSKSISKRVDQGFGMPSSWQPGPIL